MEQKFEGHEPKLTIIDEVETFPTTDFVFVADPETGLNADGMTEEQFGKVLATFDSILDGGSTVSPEYATAQHEKKRANKRHLLHKRAVERRQKRKRGGKK